MGERQKEKGREKRGRERENPGLEQDTMVYTGIWAEAPELTASLLTLGPGWAVLEPSQPYHGAGTDPPQKHPSNTHRATLLAQPALPLWGLGH